MRVLLVIAGDPEATYTLAHGAARGVGTHMGPAGLSHNSRLLTQVSQRLRATYSKPRSRGNLATQIAFTVKVELPSLEDATDYFFLYPLQLPREGTLRIMTGAGDAERRIELEDAVIESIDIPRPLGVSVEITYRIICGGPKAQTWPNDTMEGEQAPEAELQGQQAPVTEIQGEHAAETEIQGEAG
jgi:hypothetical protein